MKRLCRLSLLAAVASLGVSVAPAQAGTELPFTSTYTLEECGGGYAVSVANRDQCHVTSTASPDSGHVAARTYLVSPEGGQVPWSANSLGTAHVVATYHLPRPVPRLEFTVRVHVNDASVTLRNFPEPIHRLGESSMPWGYWRQVNVNHNAGVSVSAAAWAGQCSQGCGGTSKNVLRLFGPASILQQAPERDRLQ